MMNTSINIDKIKADMTNLGYTVIKNFLNLTQVKLALADYKSARAGIRVEDGIGNSAYMHGSGSAVVNKVFYPKVIALAKQIDPTMDTVAANGLYFSEQSFAYANWDWHQDHDVFYRWQQLHHYFNYFIPIIKENPKLSGLSIIPFDVVKKEFPQYFDKLYNGGARRFVPSGKITKVYDDETDDEWKLPVNIEDIKVSPELSPGDLLLLVGSVIHHAQDSLTHRVALSMRAVQGSYILSRKKLASGGVWKQHVMNSTPELSEMYDIFDSVGKDEMTSAEYADLVVKKYST